MTAPAAARSADERCRVLHVAWSGRVGGIERQLATIARQARREGPAGHRVLLLDGRGLVGDAVEREGLGERLRWRRSWGPLGLSRLARALRRLRPEVLHLHTHSLAAHLVALAVLPGTPWVYTERVPRGLHGGSAKFRLLYALLRRRCAQFVVLGPAVVTALVNRGVERGRIAVVPNAVGVPLRPGAPPEATGMVGIVARLSASKRVDLFLDVVAELRRRDAVRSALVVGDGPLRGELEAHARRLGIEGEVEFAGEQEDVVPWLDRLDVLLLTSPIEMFGNAALEAMARGVPVVATACRGGLADLAAEGGVLLPDREVGTAADAIASILASAEERERLRARGARVAEAASPAGVLAALEELYAGLSRPRG